MKRLNIKTVFLVIVILLSGCEGSFDSDGLVTPDGIRINLESPLNQQRCLTEGDDGNGNWVVRFDWSVIGEYEGDFSIILTEVNNGNLSTTESLSVGSELRLKANTWYNWQIQADETEAISDVFTFVTPGPPGQTTQPPAISGIQVSPLEDGYLLEFTVLDDDLAQILLFFDEEQQGAWTQQGTISEIYNLPAGEFDIRVIATDNLDNTTQQTRRYINN